MSLFKFFFILFLPMLFLMGTLQAEEDPVGYQTKSSTTDFYFAVGAEYSSSVIEIEQMDLTIDHSSLPLMEVDYLNNAEVEGPYPSFKLGYRLPFGESFFVEGSVSPLRTLNIRMSGADQLFQGDKLDPFWTYALDEVSNAFGGNYIFNEVEVSGSLAEVNLISSHISLIFRPQIHPRVKPIAGVGMQYLKFSDFMITEDNLQSSYTSQTPSAEIENTIGWFAQLGLEYGFADAWFFGAVIKYSYVPDIRVQVDALRIPIGKGDGTGNDPLAPFQTFSPLSVTEADIRLSSTSTTFSVWAGFNF